MVFLTQHIGDYPGICQGKTRIPGVNDGEEFELTDVSCVAGDARKKPNNYQEKTRSEKESRSTRTFVKYLKIIKKTLSLSLLYFLSLMYDTTI